MEFFDTVGEAVADVVEGVGNRFEGFGKNAVATAEYNLQVAGLVKAQADSKRKLTDAYVSAIKTLVVGVVIIAAVYIFGKIILPKIVK